MQILIIGATGFIGQAIVKQLVLEDVNLTLLVRSPLKAASLQALAPLKINLVTGDLTKPHLGLDATGKEKALACDMIIHCGGPMDITLSEQQAKDAFLEGSKRVMDLAQDIHLTKGLQKLIHVVGYMSPFNENASSWENTDVFKEVHPELTNAPPYEQMKFLADIYIRQQAKKSGIPLTVINPPTVIGDDQTGSTAQLDSFGLFIKTIRGGFLPVIPGGKKYRLPLINNNILAQFIGQTIFKKNKENKTYSLVADQEWDTDLPSLMSLVSKSMNMKPPRFSVPTKLLKLVMTLGGSKITGIPASSLNFVTDKSFDNQLTKNDFHPDLVQKIPAANIALAVADIDFRLTYSIEKIAPFLQVNIDGVTTYQLKGSNKPIVLLHGLFSDGTDLFNLGLALHKQTDRTIIIADLPGFGRSPFIKAHNILDPYRQMIRSIKATLPEKSIFIGHSFGAALLLEALEKNDLSNQDKVILLQPPIQKTVTEPYDWLSKIILRHLSDKQLSAYFYKNGLLLKHEKTQNAYLKRVKASFRSPRILNTTLQLNSALKKMNLEQKMNHSFDILWGTQDQSYTLAIANHSTTKLPFGHYFPISNPQETSDAIAKLIAED